MLLVQYRKWDLLKSEIEAEMAKLQRVGSIFTAGVINLNLSRVAWQQSIEHEENPFFP